MTKEQQNTVDPTNKSPQNPTRDMRNVGQFTGTTGDSGSNNFKIGQRPKGDWKLKDYQFTNNSINTTEALNRGKRRSNADGDHFLPYIEISEFQPDLLFKWQQKYKALKYATFGGYQNATLVTTGAFSGISSVIKDAASDLLSKFSNDDTNTNNNRPESAGSILNRELFVPDDDNKYKDYVLKVPFSMYRDFFDGQYVGTYELPLTDDFFLDANGTLGWNLSTEFKSSFEMLQTVKKVIDSSFPSEMPMIPEWQNKNGNLIEIHTEFHLYNNDLNNLQRNLAFLYSLAGGAFWVQVNYKQQPPNLYRVHVPGVCDLMYAAMHITIQQVGNRRNIGKSLVLPDSGITFPENTYFPDAFKVVVGFKSIVPNNFNTFIKYVLDETDKDINVGSTQSGGILTRNTTQNPI